MSNVTVTPSAHDYLADLLSKQDVEGVGVRMFVQAPGTPSAETCIAYCRPGEEQEGDVEMPLERFSMWFDQRSLPFLEDAMVDFAEDRMGGQLTIKAPNAKMPRVSDDSPLEDRINYVLYNEVNPGLASHGGQVSLREVDTEGFAILEFGGGCQGCGMVDVTLQQGVEKTLLENIPELKGVKDSTDHSDTSNAYFK
ncbi:Fe-S biogenesis protein NfuA [uncultured Umboniibacter sp.]|uniref:Fe-S biogenesis protein NfuA n=1 Tax=uncultured Umboniibacter sp. TaxID=1798917 RepID=UPI002631F84A|nr:Fe-S biogenesis protein NfuA [uncultured Umboniibacter sp.]